ncbi:MAG: HDOD domain-containing protein [Phycisphaerales bacterium]
MNPEVLEQVLSCKTLPSIPAVAARVIELTKDNNIPMKALAETITNDQGLAAKVLRTVNSSFYGMRQKCSSINQAIVMLGLSAVKTLALGFSLVSELAKLDSDGFDQVSYWRRAMYSGVAAKLIAKEAAVGSEEECFLGGLLQDVGMFALHQTLGKQYTDIIAMTNGDHRKLIRFELQELDVQHPDIGALMAERWKLPTELSMPVKYHERANAAPALHLHVVRAVALGNLASDVMTDADPVESLRRLYQKGEEWFGFKTPQADEVLKKIASAAKEMATLLSVETGPRIDSKAILAEASRRLSEMKIPDVDEMDASFLATGPTDQFDELTGLASRNYYEQTLIAAFEQARAAKMPLSLAIFEIDALEGIKTSYGEDARDTVVIHVAKRLKDAYRGTGALVAYLDGGQYAVALPKTDRVKAVVSADDAKAKIANAPVDLIAAKRDAPSKLTVTACVGVSTSHEETGPRFDDVGGLERVTEQAVRAARRAGPSSMRVYAPATMAA